MNKNKLCNNFLLLFTLICLNIFSGVRVTYAKNDVVVKDIIIKNNKRIEKETIISYLEISKGDTVNTTTLNQSLQKIYKTGLFANINISTEKGNLIVEITENPIINLIEFKGNNQIDTEDLKKEISLRQRQIFTRDKLISNITRLQSVYKRNSRFNIKIEPEIMLLQQNRVNIVFNIDEGQKNKIKKINIIGNKKFSNAEIKSILNSKEDSIFKILSGSTSFDPERFEYDKELLRRFYLNRGFLDYKLKYSTAEITYDKKYFILTIFIEEGEKYILNEVSIKSNFKKVKTEDLENLWDSDTGKTINISRVNENIDTLTKKMSELGYAFVDIKARYDKNAEKKLINVEYSINEGSKIYIDKININGNSRTLDKVIRREVTLSEGDAYNTAKINRSQRNIQNTGFFKKVDIQQKPSSLYKDKLVLDIDVEEQSTGKMQFGFGVSSNDGLLGEIGVTENNFLGKGQRVNIKYQLTEDNSEKIFSFTEPYFLDKNLSAGFNVFSRKNFDSSQYSYDSDIKGFSLNSSYPLSKNLRHSLALIYEDTEIKNVDENASIYIKSQAGEYDSLSFDHTLRYDKLNSRYEPTEGYFIKLFQSFNLIGSDSKYIKTQLDMLSYLPFTKENVIIKNVFKTGYILELDSHDVSLHDRFYLGGNSFRGFDKLGVGPRDLSTDDSLGGSFFYKTESEMILPIEFLKELNIKSSFFIDTGTLYSIPEDGDIIVDDFKIRASAGISFSWPSPIGPITVHFAWAFLKESYDDTRVINFNFGTRF